MPANENVLDVFVIKSIVEFVIPIKYPFCNYITELDCINDPSSHLKKGRL